MGAGCKWYGVQTFYHLEQGVEMTQAICTAKRAQSIADVVLAEIETTVLADSPHAIYELVQECVDNYIPRKE